MSQSHLALITRYYEDVWNRWDAAALDEIIADDIAFRGSLGVSLTGKPAFAEYVGRVRAAFPDFHNRIDDLFAAGGRVAARLTYTGTHRGELFGIPPAGRRVSYAGVALFRVRGGQVAEGYVIGDALGLQRQLEQPSREPVDIRSATLRLRSSLDADLDFVLALESAEDNRPFVGQWSRDAHQNAMRSPDFAHLVVEDGGATPVGYAIVAGLANPHRSVCLQRIVIGPKGRGWGREALRLIARFVFEQCGAHRLWLDVKEHNTRARQLYESEGFRVEGLLRDSFHSAGRYESQYLLSILRDEYAAARGGVRSI